ncbi:MAG: c-type cytochrome [Saprospiraceae bacterium]|nr:c-type cytochrome [Saprospiraceae bacterium]
MHHNSLKYCILLALISILFVGSSSAAPTAEAGKTIFQNQCAACHNKNMKDNLTGPALGGVEQRWAAYPKEDLYKWIRNSQVMIAAGHPKATELWNQFKPTVMNSFPSFTDDDIASTLLYIEAQFTKPAAGLVASAQPGGAPVEPAKPSKYIYYFLFIILAVVVAVLSRVIGNLRYLVAQEDGITLPPQKTLLQTLTSKGVIGFLIFALVVLGGYTTVNNGIAFGRQQGYAPEQPIKFSHATHAGIQGIDCQYCHDSARRSKHASIPAANTCMNCHKAIEKGTLYGTQELTKIFASIGYDPSTDKYLENYDKLSNDEIKAIYTKWIADNYLKDNSLTALDRKGERTVDEQWTEISSSMTNELKESIAGPIEWTRIHMLPDHVYFNHSQHVNIGKIDCQQCHGKVQEMDLLYQYAPLSMGWCINCHRETEVKFTSNEYYNTYKQYHDALAKGQKTKVTVEDIGGLECQKCHY